MRPKPNASKIPNCWYFDICEGVNYERTQTDKDSRKGQSWGLEETEMQRGKLLGECSI